MLDGVHLLCYLQIIDYVFREKQRHSFLLDFERIGITMATRTAEKQIHSYDILLYQYIELPYIRILCVFNLLVSKVFLAVMLFILDFNPECFMMFGEQSLVQFHQTPCCNILQSLHLCLKFKFVLGLVDIQEEELTISLY